MNPQIFTDHLSAQRWFAGKGREWQVTDVQSLPVQGGDLVVRIMLVTVTYPAATGDEATETYQVPVVLRNWPADHLGHAFIAEYDEDGRHWWVYDALHDKDVTGLWTHGIADNRSLEAVRFVREPSADDFPAGEPSLVIGAEQSNTSLIYGDALILKVLRKVAPGLSPDIELHGALAAAASPHIARPLGWVEGSWRDPATGEQVTGSLAILQEFLRNASEGWEMAKTSVRDLLAEGDLHADEVGGDFASESHRLGAVTAEVHIDLARVLPTGSLDSAGIREVAGGMRRRLDAAAAEVGELAPYAEAIAAVFDGFAALDQPLPVQRVHGDFHLGQVMRTLHGWKLLDFEGEPARPLSARRALDSPVKDVAGMLRSFDYAAHQFLATGGGRDPQRDYRSSEWAQRNREAFCDGYAEASGHDPREEADGSAVVLRAYEADKAVYEVLYDARNRPAWLPIPLAGVARIAGAGTGVTDLRHPTPTGSRTP